MRDTPGIVLAISAIVALTYKHLCQFGPSIEFVPGDVDISKLNTIERTIVDGFSTMIEVLQTSSSDKISFVCPEESGIFAGQICTITNSTTSDNPAAVTASVNGGLYVVAAFWTERGINNPFAVTYNLIIGTCWALISFWVAICFPPVRKFRDVLFSFIIPGTLEGVAALLESMSRDENHGDGDGDGDEVNPLVAEREKLSAIAKKIAPQKNAGLLYFEPRLCHDPAIDYIPILETFLKNIQSAVLILFNYHGDHWKAEEPGQSETIKVLRTVASAVKGNDLSILEGVTAKSINWDDIEGELHDLTLSEVFGDLVSSIHSSGRAYLEAYNNVNVKEEEKHRGTTIRRTLRAWFTNATCSCGNITSSWPLIGIRMLLGKQGAGLQNNRRLKMALLWSAKWTAGAVALTCIEVFGQGFHADFAIKREMGEPNWVLLGTLQGWALFAYFLAFQFSMEGTIKKVSIDTFLLTITLGFLCWLSSDISLHATRVIRGF